MRYFDGLTYEEIAEVKAIRLGTVKSRLHKAKELLKKELLKEGKFNVMDFFDL
jgi:RNA polymerase sigma-70 factor (ECF subfamily)